MLMNRSPAQRGQRGLSLVEMMVGVAVGLVVVAGAALMVSSQIGENRRLLVETQLQQDMRASMDLITRELRRIGAQREASALDSLAPVDGGSGRDNPMARMTSTTSGVAMAHPLYFTYQPTVTPNPYFGYEFQAASGVVKSYVWPRWQDLTDANVMEVTAMSVTPKHSSTLRLTCANACSDGSTDCWPEIVVRDIDVVLTARARSDANVVRTLRSTVRVRNDLLKYQITATEACPP